MLPLDIQRRVDAWLSGPFDENTKSEILTLKKENPQKLIDSFFCDLSFGTGGMRELMGVGTNRINIYTIRLATQGLATYLKKQNSGQLSVLIGFDNRKHSQEFAEQAACVLAGNGIHVYLLDELRPTPYISFASRLKKANAAINITASHNSKEYNGYKVYWSDGAQVVHPHDAGIFKEIEKLKDLSSVNLSSIEDPLIEHVLTQSLDALYLQTINPLQHFVDANKSHGPSLKIVYTSLHGTGITIVPKALKDWGFTTIELVTSQVVIDPEFSTVKYPNPEYKETLQLGIEILEHTQSDLLIATDPDADRIGIVTYDQGKSVLFSGNEMAAICAEYLCEVTPKLTEKSAIVTTIVTTELLKAIAKNHHISCIEVLTGFKYIGEKIHLWETSKEEYQFLFGAEESYGYLFGTHSRDKDAIISSCLIAEITLYAKGRGEALLDRLHQIYTKYGVYREKQMSLNFLPSQLGIEQMSAMMRDLRLNPMLSINDCPVVCIEDYMVGSRLFLKSKKIENLDLPQADVLLFRLEDNSRLVIRPSGTEPKIKIYGSTSSSHFETIAMGIKDCDQRLDLLLNALKKLSEHLG